MDESQQIGRTRGDGMENDHTPSSAPADSRLPSEFNVFTNQQMLLKDAQGKSSSFLGQNLIFRESHVTPSLPAVLPKGKIFNLIPRLVPTTRPFSLQHKNREPRFVPFEPYKAAINPILPQRKCKPIKNRKNNLDLNTLVSHMSNMKTSSLSSLTQDIDLEQLSELEVQRVKYEKELENMRKDRDCVAAQLKSQVQVNTELKNLLVAAVGEDLQTRVNVLTEDKLQLARALLSTAQNLSSHTEQIEYLAGQSEVWRSKFLASSLMVEELARWKASLTQKNKLLLESNKQMLQTMSTIRDMEIEALSNLKFLSQQKVLNLPSSNVLDLTAECLNISQQLILHSGIGMPSSMNLTGLDTMTDAEKISIQALQTSNEPLMSTDEAFKAVVGQAFPSSKMVQMVNNSLE